MKRRTFLRTTSTIAAGISMPHLIPKPVFGANDKVITGFIGIGGRARWLMTKESMPEAKIVAVADCFPARFGKMVEVCPESEKWNKYDDYFKMFDKENLDAVFVETTTHARVLTMIHAAQAGLDVYGEKPLTLTIGEGRTLVKAIQKTNCVLQTGSQQRSIPINRWASKRIRDGAIGKVKEIIVCNFEGPARWTPKPAEPQPEGLDWDRWCNQTELRPYHPDLHYKWALWRAYDGGGQSWGVTGWGTHSLDQAQCGLGTDDTGPVEIWPDSPKPDAIVTMRFANGTLLKMNGERRGHEDLGAIFVGEKGTIEIMRGRCAAEPKELLDGAPPDTPEGPEECREHLHNFFECVRSREKTTADVETGHRATTLCHLVNICRELGRKVKWDPQAEKFIGDDEANRLLSRPRRKGYELPDLT